MQCRYYLPFRLMPLLLVLALAGIGRCRWKGRSSLALWIDQRQVDKIVGVPMKISIIHDGQVTPYVNNPGIMDQILIPSDVDMFNLTWQAGHESFWYSIDKFASLDNELLYPPLLGVPTRGTIPSGPTVFQITIPCKGRVEGVASLLLELTIRNRYHRTLPGTPINLKLRKKCDVFDEYVHACLTECQNGGMCSDHGACSCKPGYKGKHCEIAACVVPCQNGGYCVSHGLCWCGRGFYGNLCEFETKEERPRRSKLSNKEQHKTREKTRADGIQSKQKKLEQKLLLAEKRVLVNLLHNGNLWTLTREERRTLRRLQREPKTNLLLGSDRRFLVHVMTRERRHFIPRHKKSLRRYKKLLKKERQSSQSKD